MARLASRPEGENFRKALEKNQLKQTDIARAFHIKPTTVWAWTRSGVPAKTAKRAASLLRVKAETITSKRKKYTRKQHALKQHAPKQSVADQQLYLNRLEEDRQYYQLTTNIVSKLTQRRFSHMQLRIFNKLIDELVELR